MNNKFGLMFILFALFCGTSMSQALAARQCQLRMIHVFNEDIKKLAEKKGYFLEWYYSEERHADVILSVNAAYRCVRDGVKDSQLSNHCDGAKNETAAIQFYFTNPALPRYPHGAIVEGRVISEFESNIYRKLKKSVYHTEVAYLQGEIAWQRIWHWPAVARENLVWQQHGRRIYELLEKHLPDCSEIKPEL